MKFSFTQLTTTALTGLAALGFASASFATPVNAQGVREGSLDAHVVLVRALDRAGVSLVLNHSHCQEIAGINGFYSGQNRLLVVCNDRYIPGIEENPEWTANDLDTLRHEAQHFIQDCMVGTNHDHTLSSVYKDPVALGRYVLGQGRLDNITRIYREQGASDHVLRMEYEAFSVAAMNVPLEQSQDIQRYCLGG